ncbi:MAG: thioesterase [Marinilabiliaceae bacterium]|nr:thioesterase [Marinilabiliaceae bacterium]
MLEKIFSKDIRTATYDVGANGQISITALQRYFQEAAHEHANKLGVGFEKLRKKNIFWVLSALWFKIDKLPGFDKIITVNTWPRGIDKFYSLRDVIFFHDNKTVAKATSLWLTIDINSKRIVRPETIFNGVDYFSDNRVFDDNFAPIITPTEKILIEERQVRYSDLDINRHVNNVKYIEWIFDAIENNLAEKNINELKIQYLGEFVENEKASIYRGISDDPNKFIIEINHEKGKTGIRGEVSF